MKECAPSAPRNDYILVRRGFKPCYTYFNPLGIALLVALIVFLIFKLLFLIVNIMYDITYGSDDAERGESGRRVKKSDSDFFFG